MTIFALVDCNNFYASCERVFDPRLAEQPIIILSNNDGCVISRSNEAKKLGISIGAPYFQWKEFCRKHHVAVFSSNYELYGDMSRRVMQTLKHFCPDMEVYSIDEAFLILDSFSHRNLTTYMTHVRNEVKRWTGIPVSIGFAHTKTLAKVANHIAKKQTTSGVFDLFDATTQTTILEKFVVRDVWGVGARLSKKLNELNIFSAKDLRDADAKRLRSYFSVQMEKTISELRGVSCIPIELIQPRKQIVSSRSFGKQVTLLSELEEAVSFYADIASEKCRRQKSVANAVGVFVETNRFNEKLPQYNNSIAIPFSIPTSDSRYIISTAKKALRQIFRKGFYYKKAGMMLLDLQPEGIKQVDLFQDNNLKSETLMKTVDEINQLMGRDTVFYCAQGVNKPWLIRSDYRSPRYTTRWSELLQVR